MRATGSGWIGVRGFGAGQRTEGVWNATDTLEQRLATAPTTPGPRNYGRFDRASRMVCHALHLALRDAGYVDGRAVPEGSGLVGTGDMGTLAANTAYYDDYCSHGKVLGRSNLFLYTLPTSPLGEAAIYWRLRGPLLYVAGADTTAAFWAAADLLDSGAAPRMLVCEAAADAAIVHVLERAEAKDVDKRAVAIAAALALRRIAAGQDGSRA